MPQRIEFFSGVKVTKKNKLLCIRRGTDSTTEIETAPEGTGLGKIPVHGIVYLLGIRKWVCHVYAVFNVFVLMHDDLDQYTRPRSAFTAVAELLLRRLSIESLDTSAPLDVIEDCSCAAELKPNSITLAGSELAPNMFGASSELASVMEFGFQQPARSAQFLYNV